MDDAVRCFQAALAAEPDDRRLQAMIGFAFVADLGDVAQGLALLERAVRADPVDPEIRRLHGRACDLVNDWDGAIAEFRERARLLPNDPQAHSDLGDILDWSGDPTAAIPAYRASLRLNSSNEDTHSSLAYALLDAGDVAGARAEWEYAKGLGNRQLSTLWLAADLAAVDGDRFSARRAIDAVLARTDQNGIVPLRIAVESLIAFRDPELRGGPAAVAAARRMVELRPRAGLAWSSLGAALHGVGDAEGCIAAEERAMALLAGGSPTEWLPLALSLEQSGRHAKALEWKRQSLDWIERRRARHPWLLILRDEANERIRE
jgi:Flp pilus assembly protein TadD